jgi:hypothetical protein
VSLVHFSTRAADTTGEWKQPGFLTFFLPPTHLIAGDSDDDGPFAT